MRKKWHIRFKKIFHRSVVVSSGNVLHSDWQCMSVCAVIIAIRMWISSGKPSEHSCRQLPERASTGFSMSLPPGGWSGDLIMWAVPDTTVILPLTDTSFVKIAVRFLILLLKKMFPLLPEIFRAKCGIWKSDSPVFVKIVTAGNDPVKNKCYKEK